MTRPGAVAVDLDGVVWRAGEVVPGSVDALARLVAAGTAVVYVTNNAGPELAAHEAKLEALGVPAVGRVVSSPMAAASLLGAGERVLVAGGDGVAEAVAGAGCVPVTYEQADDPAAAPIDAVLVGYHRDFDYEKLRIASTAIRDRGARFIATNDDATFPTDAGEVPGNGAIVAAIATAAGIAPVIAGKPYEPIAELVRRRCGPQGVVVGDRPDTDGRLARVLGWAFALVLTGVTAGEDLPVDPEPDLVADDLAAVVDRLLAP